MILADENIDHSLIASIRQLGIEVFSVYELQRGTPDIFKDTERIRQILIKILSERRPTLFGKFTTVTIHKIRTRVL